MAAIDRRSTVAHQPAAQLSAELASRRSSLLLRLQRAHRRCSRSAPLGAVNYIAAKQRQAVGPDGARRSTRLAPQTLLDARPALKEPVHAIGFLPADHPAHEALEAIFERYHAEAPDKFELRVQGPAQERRTWRRKYQLKEGQTTVVLTRGEGDKATPHRAQRALRAGAHQRAHQAQHGGRAEGLLPGRPRRVAAGARRAAGPGEASVQRSPSSRSSLLQEGYAPEELNLVGRRTRSPGTRRWWSSPGPAARSPTPEKAALDEVPRRRAGGCSTSPRRRRRAGPGQAAGRVRHPGRPGPASPTTSSTRGNPYVIVSPFFGDTRSPAT